METDTPVFKWHENKRRVVPEFNLYFTVSFLPNFAINSFTFLYASSCLQAAQ